MTTTSTHAAQEAQQARTATLQARHLWARPLGRIAAMIGLLVLLAHSHGWQASWQRGAIHGHAVHGGA